MSSNDFGRNNIFIDNVTKDNISTYINKYMSDTIYILQLQLNSFLFNDSKNNTSIFLGEEGKDLINLIKKINNSLEKELFYLNNPKIKDISKLIKVLIQRNELLNKLMNYFFGKQKIIQAKEKIVNNKFKDFLEYNKDNYKSSNQNILNLNEYPKLNSFIGNIKKNNQYNFKNIPSYSVLDSDRTYHQNCFDDNNKRKRKDSKELNIKKSNDIKKSKYHLNKSCDMNDNFNNLTITYTENIKLNAHNKEDFLKNNYRKIKENKKLTKRRVNSVVNKTYNHLLIGKHDKNNTKINLKNIYQLNKLNLEKLNEISSNILLIDKKINNDINN